MNESERSSRKRREIPGKMQLLIDIGSINAQIKKIDEEIKQNVSKIEEILKGEKERSPKTIHLAGIFENSEKIKALREERKGLYEISEGIKEKINQLKMFLGAEHSSGSFSEEKINSQMEALEMKLIRESVSPIEEKQIAAELTALRAKKGRMGDIKESVKSLRELEENYRENRAKIAAINKELKSYQETIEKCKEELTKLNEGPKVKNPLVEQLYERVKILKSDKSKQIEFRDQKRTEIHALEEEYKKLEQEILVAKEIETQKDEIRLEINEKNKQIEEITKKISRFDSKIFDSLHFSIEKLIASKRFYLSADVISQLLHHSISIPKDEETAKFVLRELVEKKLTADSTFREKTAKYQAEIEGVRDEIKKLNNKLNEMPESNYDLLKKGGYKKTTFA
ncbi:hypothetical protein NUSPORA_01207 [Nucleospora cyclopteri]